VEPRAEQARLAALRSYGLLDAARPAVLDDLTRLAASVLDTPMSLVTLVDADRQWFAGRTGLSHDQDPRASSFCAQVVEDGRPLVVPDAREHPVFRDYANVTGRPHIRHYAGAPLVDHDGYVLGAVCVLDDQPREIGDRQLDLLRQLAGQAGAPVSHELRTPVTSIQGYLEMLVEEDELAPYRRYLDPIRRNGERLVTMVDHLLAGTGPAESPVLERIPVDLVAVAEAAIAATAAPQAYRDVRCVLETAGPPAKIRGDFAQLAQAVQQLLRNAIGFSPGGSRVRVVVSFTERAPSIQVVDDGVGIPADELPHVLDRFHRGRHARGEAVPGVGLGLSIAQNVVAAHGGSLTITSPGPGLGTTARISLRPDFPG
jgi:signal transduction histidine kinase